MLAQCSQALAVFAARAPVLFSGTIHQCAPSFSTVDEAASHLFGYVSGRWHKR